MTVEAPALQTQALLDAINRVAAQPDLDAVLETVLREAVALVGVETGAFGVLREDGEVLRFVTTGPESDAWARIADPPPGHEPLVVPVRVGGAVYGLLYLVGDRDHGFTPGDEALVRALADAAAPVLGHARAYTLSERRRRWLEAATDLCHAVAELGPRDGALEQVVRRARAASGALAAAVVALPREGAPAVRVYDGPPGLVGEGALLGAVVGPAADGLVAAPLDARLAEPSALVLVLPPDADAEEERDLLAAYADQAGLALDRAQAVRDARELAVVSERERIARDLHDSVIQRLFAAGLQLQTLREAPPDLVQEGVDVTVDALDAVIREIRSTVMQLRD